MTKFVLIFSLGLLQSPLVFGESQSNREVLERVWRAGQAQSCTLEMRSRFSEERLAALVSSLVNQEDRDVLSSVLNPFLFSLGMSHTKFLTTKDEDFYFFKSHAHLVNPELPAPPSLLSPGIQLGKDPEGYFVREVLDGLAAQKAGVLRGDRIVSFEGEVFKGTWGARPGVAKVNLLRDGEPLSRSLEIRALNWSEALQSATRESVRVLKTNRGAIGYVRLWTGTHPQSAPQLWQIVRELKPKVRAMILDLRGGYGGAWWEHLDPFFADSSSYFTAQRIDADGLVTHTTDEPHANSEAFLGPMAVLINEGVRSGKEALAYQFKKTGRARLIGSKTPGYFSAGAFLLTEEPADYALYLCVQRVTLDGREIEGIGILPDEEVRFEPKGEYQDSQLEAAVRYLKEGAGTSEAKACRLRL